MPYARETLAQLQSDVASDIAGAAQGADALLRFANLRIVGKVQAGIGNMHYGYLDWISKQAVPFTAVDEYLQGWGALKGVFIELAQPSTGTVTFPGTADVDLPSGTAMVRGDGVTYTTTEDGTVGADGTVTVSATADPDPTGQSGAIGNMDAGTVITLSQSIDGIQSNGSAAAGWQNGTDIETNSSFRNRVMQAYQTPPAGGNTTDYVNWAKDVPGVTRAWAFANYYGVGTMVVFVMLDVENAATGGFPNGTAGVAAADPRGVTATGDLLTVANALFADQASLGVVYVAPPIPNPVTLTVTGLPPSLQASATAAVSGLFLTEAVPGQTVPYENIWSAINSIAAGNYFALSPDVDVTNGPGQIPILQPINFPD